MTDVKGVVVDPSKPERLAIRSVPLMPAYRDEVTVRVRAISLNRGEVNRAVRSAEPGWRPGWDFAGMVEDPLRTAAVRPRERAWWEFCRLGRGRK